MNINHRHYILLLIALITLGVSGTSYLFLYREVVTRAKASAEAVAEVTLENNKKLHEQELMATYADSLTDRTRIAASIVSESKIVDFIEQVEKIGDSSGTDLQISGIDTQKSDPKSTTASFNHIIAHIDVSGSWINIMRALLLIENMPYSVVLNNIKLSTSGDVTSAVKGAPHVHKWSLSLDIRVLSAK